MDETTEQTVKEAKMTEEKAQVTEQEAKPEQPVSEIPEEQAAETEQPTTEAATTQEELAELVRGCVAESKECKDLGARFDDTAKRLGIPVNQLIDEVFELVKKAK